ncbi:MAG: caspase family protein [Proteobacteria bacterium]|nr:caspase family protein [Pseudomonadota bacterium]
MRHAALITLTILLAGAGAAPVAAQAVDPARNECARGEPQASIAACTTLLQGRQRLSPRDSAIVLTNRGNSYVKINDRDRAMADYDLAIRTDQQYARAWNERGLLNRKKGEYDRAISDYSQALILNPDGAVHYGNRGTAYRWKGEYDRALADLSTAIQIDAKRPLPFMQRGIVYRLKRDFARAIADHDQSIQLDPRVGNYYYERGATYEAQGDFVKALGDYRVAQTHGSTVERLPQAISRAEGRLTNNVVASPGPGPGPGPVQSAGLPPVIGGTAAARSETRIALIIGNSQYVNAAALPNPTRDAQALAATLRRIGFNQVTLKLDLPREKMLDELRIFAGAADRADWAVVYFAGHGLEIGGTNYLVPVEAKLGSDRDANYEGVGLDKVLHAVEGARKLGLVILDACRDNPFVKSMQRTRGASRSVGRGLANIEPDGATLVAYAAKHGQVAEDGAGVNSPFMTALLKNLETPGLEISLLFRRVRDDVLAATGKRQEPFTYGSLPSEAFYFRGR